MARAFVGDGDCVVVAAAASSSGIISVPEDVVGGGISDIDDAAAAAYDLDGVLVLLLLGEDLEKKAISSLYLHDVMPISDVIDVSI